MTERAPLCTMSAPRVLLLPGWNGSGPDHWQSRWAQQHGDERVDQDDWAWPKRGDWMSQLEQAVLQSPDPVVLVAHSLGCHLVSAWAAHTARADSVAGALLVAPPDLDRDDLPPQLAPWRSSARRALPFPSVVVFSEDDPYCRPERAQAMAEAWGSLPRSEGARGHLNGDSGLGDWPQGRALLQAWGVTGRSPRGDAAMPPLPAEAGLPRDQ